MKEEIEQIETHFMDISLSDLIKKGMDANDFAGKLDKETKYRWAVNFARHAAEAVRNEVLKRIAQQWPELESECRRQSR